MPPIGPVKSVALLVRFRQLEIGRGIVPFGGATFRVPAQLGWGNAMRFLLTAEEFGAAEALRIGLVQEVVPAGLGRGPDAGRDAIASLLPGIMRSQDAAEGLRSFTERREAHFTGR